MFHFSRNYKGMHPECTLPCTPKIPSRIFPFAKNLKSMSYGNFNRYKGRSPRIKNGAFRKNRILTQPNANQKRTGTSLVKITPRAAHAWYFCSNPSKLARQWHHALLQNWRCHILRQSRSPRSTE